MDSKNFCFALSLDFHSLMIAASKTPLVTTQLIVVAGSQAALLTAAFLSSSAGRTGAGALVGGHVNLRGRGGGVVLGVEVVGLMDVVLGVDDLRLDGLPVDDWLHSLVNVAVMLSV